MFFLWPTITKVLNADFEKYEESALEDIELNFFIPHFIKPEFEGKWIRCIVQDNEIYDSVQVWLKDLQQNFKKNQEIVAEFQMNLEDYRKGRTRRKSKFLKQHDFAVKVPTKHRDLLGSQYYLGTGQWGYHLSNFVNVLDFGPMNYLDPLEVTHRWYRKKRGKNPLYVEKIKELLN